ncbi:hypothetical protein, partial [Enterococcus faecalis]|uniref:hypothetical protein n=1 Tax=Enterococcus faecalis TaxID=1351 RepID=UPI00403F554C
QRGLRPKTPSRGEMAQEYVDISSHLDAAMGLLGQTPKGWQNGFHLGPKCACKGNQPSPCALRTDMFAILPPR